MDGFDRALFASNIKVLAKERNIKMGDLEKAAGVSAGYISRMSKDDSNAAPSVEFLISVANQLHVTTDNLLKHDFSGLTSTEHYIMSFIQKLIIDTKKDKLLWDKDIGSDLKNIQVFQDGSTNHPLFSVDYDGKKYNPCYDSKFHFDYIIRGECYVLQLPSRNDTYIHLMFAGEDPDDITLDKTSTELYLIKNDKVTPLASSDNQNFREQLDELYNSVQESCLHPRLDDEVISVINDFMADVKYVPSGPFSIDDQGDLPF